MQRIEIPKNFYWCRELRTKFLRPTSHSHFLIRKGCRKDYSEISKLSNMLISELFGVNLILLFNIFSISLLLVAGGYIWWMIRSEGLTDIAVFYIFFSLIVLVPTFFILRGRQKGISKDFWAAEEVGSRSIVAIAKTSDLSTESLIGNLFVLPDFRKKGLGSSIVKKLINETSKKRICLEVRPKIINFYEHLGFSVDQTESRKKKRIRMIYLKE